ncbi:hypothetical protein [Archangium violaceum]|nr:hypothetical protein [Archangium violaceum]
MTDVVRWEKTLADRTNPTGARELAQAADEKALARLLRKTRAVARAG